MVAGLAFPALAWAGRTPDPPPGQVIPFSYLQQRFEPIVRQMADDYADLLARACTFDPRFPPENRNAEWRDLVVRRLHQLDSRWGYNWKRGQVGLASADVIDYHFDSGPDETTRQFDDGHVYGVDLISDCGGRNGVGFIDISVNGVLKWARHTLPRYTPISDYDGDGLSDLTVFRPSTGQWFVRQSSGQGTLARNWGAPGDLPAPGDYDGDGVSDIGVFRQSNGTWYVLRSSGQFQSSLGIIWGGPGDLAAPGDYDGDGRTDPAVFRPSMGTWFVLFSSTQYTTSLSGRWGGPGDIPVPGDYDGDGRTDLAIYRPATGDWFILQSATGRQSYIARTWGSPGDIPWPGDTDGDSFADMRVYRPSTGRWYVLGSMSGFASSQSAPWGGDPSDLPAAADFGGDGLQDLTVFRNGVWFVRGVFTAFWGNPGDIPVAR